MPAVGRQALSCLLSPRQAVCMPLLPLEDTPVVQNSPLLFPAVLKSSQLRQGPSIEGQAGKVFAPLRQVKCPRLFHPCKEKEARGP